VQPQIISTDIVTQYAQDVANGQAAAGPHVRAACARHLRDLEEQEKRGIYWDLEKALHVINFFPIVLRLNGGKFEGLPFDLQPWQAFIVGSVFGWKWKDTGHRRFNTVYIETAKGSGKSPLAAGIGIYCLVADGEARAEVYAAATKRDQAMILFRDAVAMVDQSPDLTKNLRMSGGKGKEWDIAYHKTASFFRPISSDDGQSGPRPHVGLIDELHEHKNGIVVEMIRAGFKFRTQPILIAITNSGTDKKSVCWEYRQFGAEVSAGSRDDDTMFAYICALDEKDDPFKDESCWAKANPSLGKTIEPKYLRDQVTQAKGMPAKESLVKRLNFCIWTEAANPWITYEAWFNAADKLVDDDIYKNRKCYGGLDLSSTTDLTAFVLAFEPTDDDPVWRLREWFWLPAEGIKKKSDLDRVDYVNWAQHGYLELTPGKAVSKRFVLQRIMQITEGYNLSSICYDMWRIEDLKQVAADEAITLPNMIGFGQGYKDMAPALDLFEEKLINNGIMHDGNPVMTWCAANAVIESDAAGNRKVAKDKAKGRVDGVVAAIMSIGAKAKEDIKPAKKYQVYSVKR